MRTAIFERSTSLTRPHVIVVELGEGDRRELTVQQAQHLFESLGMALADYENYMTNDEATSADVE